MAQDEEDRYRLQMITKYQLKKIENHQKGNNKPQGTIKVG